MNAPRKRRVCAYDRCRGRHDGLRIRLLMKKSRAVRSRDARSCEDDSQSDGRLGREAVMIGASFAMPPMVPDRGIARAEETCSLQCEPVWMDAILRSDRDRRACQAKNLRRHVM